MHVAPSVLEATELSGQLRQRLLERPTSDRETFDEKQRRQDAVALRQVEGEGVTPALLAARDGLAPVHQLGHVLEADSGLDQRSAERARDPVDLEGGRKGLRDAAAHATVAKDVEQQERENLVRGHEPSLRV